MSIYIYREREHPFRFNSELIYISHTILLTKKEKKKKIMSWPKICFEDWDQEWVSSLWKKVEGARNHRQTQPGTRSIFRVSEHIRSTDSTAYDPKVVSIGPYHRTKQQLNPMEDVKLFYLSRFLNRSPTDQNLQDNNPRVRFDVYLRIIHELNATCRSFYAEKICMGNRDFSYMMLLDGCFIIELFLQNHYSTQEQKLADPILCNMLTLSLVEFDMLLLENQIPFVLLERLYSLVVSTDEENALFLVPISVAFFDGLVKGLAPLKYDKMVTDFYHLLHMFHSYFIVPPMEQLQIYNGNSRTIGMTTTKRIRKATESVLMTPCATDLIDVGVKIKRKLDQSFSWHITPEKRIIEISPARLCSNCNSFYRNLITFEQYLFPHVWSKVMAYVMFMSCLIDSEKDLALLRQERIIAYTLDNKEATMFFRKLCKDSIIDYDKSYLSHLHDKSMDVWDIYDTQWTRYKTELKRSCINNPLSILYLIVSVVFVVVLTVLQAVYTVISYYKSKN